uniref:Nudix hydrolase domain-containing protein n=1 Tax=Chromera velia CCMP2878 TaxID=1169474 RepID=A0A0G4GHL7_9ALVE|eukprot:Cvel_21924.t1-p1 / transcript=Cvel_21924.t1 / gene=Cvel_21924 / organism=Chromera_velia_CCMP2878 / gene_product=hypothetical protein / transcript_product=hypothetical protein / location=Cvel_scaffold2102:19099-21108(-) / protein_length=296 / sequence_SO=supercontig / SO=protein_coding / is_pseudo=false
MHRGRKAKSESFGVVLVIEEGGNLNFVLQMSASAGWQPTDRPRQKVDPFRGKQEGSESGAETAARELWEESMRTFKVPADLLTDDTRGDDNLFFLRVLLQNPQEDLKSLTSVFSQNAKLIETSKRDLREVNGLAIVRASVQPHGTAVSVGVESTPYVARQVQMMLRSFGRLFGGLGALDIRGLIDALPAAHFEKRTHGGLVWFEATRSATVEERKKHFMPTPEGRDWRYSPGALERYKRQIEEYPQDLINRHREDAMKMADEILRETLKSGVGGEEKLLSMLRERQKEKWGETQMK